jgi:signal transduction histidine kinase
MSLFAIWPAFNLRDKLQAATQELFEAAEANNRLAILEERHRIAHELHDTVSQTLFGANLIAEGIQTTLTSDPEQAYHKLDEFRHATSSALAGMRLMLVELHPRGIMEVPLDLTIIQLTQTSWGRTGIEIATEISGSSTIYPGDVQLALYRITQQAITNAIQHAAATQITVRLEQQRNTLALTIEDNGVGFAPGLIKPGRFGVPTMECRARSVGATLVIDSAPGSGTRIIATWKGACVDEDKSAGG